MRLCFTKLLLRRTRIQHSFDQQFTSTYEAYADRVT